MSVAVGAHARKAPPHNEMLWLVAVCVGVAWCGQVTFDSVHMTSDHIRTRVAMFSLDDAPFHKFNKSQVALDRALLFGGARCVWLAGPTRVARRAGAVHFSMEEGKTAVELHLLTFVLFHSSLGWRVGHYDADNDRTEFCCTSALAAAGVQSKM